MNDRLVSMKTVLQIVVLLALGSASGLIYNATRAEGKVDLDRQYFSAKVAAGKNAGKTPQRPTPGDAGPSDPVKPDTVKPDTVKPDAVKPDAVKPDTVKPDTVKPDSVKPETNVPDAGDPTPVPEDPPPPPADGLQRMSLADCKSMIAEQGVAVFVDARKKADYDAGHIPGAVHLSHYDSANQIDEVRPQLEQAFFIIVYCNGGQCEDSINLAFDLISVYGFLHENVYVYEGGMEKWVEAGLEVEKNE